MHFVDELQAGRVRLVYGHAQAFADSPARASGDLQTARLPSGARRGWRTA